MGILNDLKTDVTNALKDEVSDLELIRESGTYNVASGTTTTTELIYSGTGFDQSVSDEYMSEEVTAKNSREIVLFQSELGPSGTAITPEVGDEVDYEGTRFDIMAVDSGPSDTLWTVVGRD